MNYLNDIKELIEKDIVLKKKHRLIENSSTLTTYFEIGRLIVEAQGGKERSKYGNNLINIWSKSLWCTVPHIDIGQFINNTSNKRRVKKKLLY